MKIDRVIAPEEFADIIRGYLEGRLDGVEAAHRAMRLAGSSDRILAGHRTRVAVDAYWAIRRLAETGPGRPDDDRMSFLLACLEGRKRFPRED